MTRPQSSTPQPFRPQPSRQFRVLHREFLFRIVDRELLSAHATGDASQFLLQIAALLIFLSLLFLIPTDMFKGNLLPQVRLILALSMEHFLIATTMLVVGLLAVLSWDNMFPDRRDVFVLAPLPVRVRTVLLAKVAAIGTGLGLTVLALHAATGLVWPLVLNAPTPALTVPTRTSEAAIPPVAAADMESVLDKDLARVLHNGPLAPGAGGGLAIGLYTRGVRRVFAYGAASPDSLFEIGSITKPFTGQLLAHMVEEGKVRLDQPVRELLPEVAIARPTGPEIALLDLATHRSGLPALPGNFGARNRSVIEATRAVGAYDATKLHAYLVARGVWKPPQGAFRYSNLGFGLLGHALATRAGMDYATLLRETITGPLGMTDTAIVLSSDQRRRFLPGFSGDREPVPYYEFNVLAGAGAVRSTAADMLTWLEANLHPERLPAGTLRSALISSHQVRATVWAGPRIALAWFAPADSGIYTHGGATAGYTADAFFSPRDDAAAIVLSNAGPGSAVSADIVGAHVRSRMTGTRPVSIEEMRIPPGGGTWALLRLYAAYWITMFAAGVFMFGMVMGVQGFAAQLLPRRYFLRVSSFLQLGAFALIMSVYSLQGLMVSPATLSTVQGGGLPGWSPSYWFLGLFQSLTGSPVLAPLAQRAWIGLGVAMFAAATAYALSYFRVLRKIAEEPDIVPGASGFRWLPPFGSRPQTAIVQFSIKTLLRSSQHRVIVAFYLGIGFAASIFFLKLPRDPATTAATDEEWLAGSLLLILSSLLMLGFAVLGARMAFSLPRDLRANWIFRITPLHGGPQYLTARRRSLLVLSVVPVWTAWAFVFLRSWPWQPAVAHLVVLALAGLVLAELSLHGVQKIPFTCAYLPGKSTFHTSFWMVLTMAVPFALITARYEQEALQDPWRYAVMVGLLAAACIVARVGIGWMSNAADASPAFEEERRGQMVALNLWDVRVTPASAGRTTQNR